MIGTETKTSRDCILGVFAKRTQFLQIIPEASGHRDEAPRGNALIPFAIMGFAMGQDQPLPAFRKNSLQIRNCRES